MLGSGLGFLAEEIGEPIVIPYGQIPHFQTSTAPDHAGRFVLGTLAGRRVMAMQGRLHLYEGYTAQQVSYPVRVAKLLGVNGVSLWRLGTIPVYSFGDIRDWSWTCLFQE